MNTNYEGFYFDNFIERYAVAKGKAVIYLRSWGWNNSSNVDAINASMDVYREILPIDLFTLLSNSEFVFVEVDDIDEAYDFVSDNFPVSQESCTTPENYIHFTLYNELGQTIASN